MSVDRRERLVQLLDLYRDGSLSVAESHELAALLDDPQVAALATTLLETDGLIALALDAEDAHAAASQWRQRLAADDHAARFRDEFTKRQSETIAPWSPQRRSGRRALRWAAAALLLIAIAAGAFPLILATLTPDLALARADAGTVLWRGTTKQAGRSNVTLLIGDRVEQVGGATAELRFADGSHLTLIPGTSVTVQSITPAKRLRLTGGTINASVSPQPDGHPLRLLAATAEVVVIGTEFKLTVDAQAATARIDVDHGLVRLASVSTGEQVEVAAGQVGSLAADGSLTTFPGANAKAWAAIGPFFENNCYSCHGEKKQKGKFRLDQAPRESGAPGFEQPWSMALERITNGEMPPPEEKQQPTQAARLQAAEWITDQLKLAEAQRLATSEKVSLRKLTREEYANTLRDLLGVTYEPADPGGLPEDPNWHGFERIGPVQTLSPAHIERYLAAAEMVMDEVLPTGAAPKPLKQRMGMQQLRGGPNDHDPFIMSHARIDIAPNGSTNFKSPHSVWIERPGEYRISVSVSGLRPPGGSAPHLYVYSASLDRVWIARDIDTPENKPEIVTAEVFLPAGEIAFMIYNALPGIDPYENAASGPGPRPFFTLKRERSPTQQKLTDDDYVPLVPILILDYIEFAGPLDRSRAGQLITAGKRDAAHARQIVTAFAERAFRRPVRAEDAARLSGVAEKSLAKGASFEQAVKDACIAVLCAQDFLALVEGSALKPRATLDDWEVASRLSYFLWSSMPDDALFARARAGQLTKPADILAETKRLLADPKAERFVADFARQWLHLRDVGKFPPNRKLFPLYDEQMEFSMKQEPVAYVRDMLRGNRSLREFIASDWTMVNAPLARLYGIPGIVDMKMQKVTLKPEDHRGGLLTQAAILSQTSDGTRHKPINRGKLVMEMILGKSPPPPPPNAGDIPTTQANQPKATVRQKLTAHRQNESCAGCHAKIDPLGFAFDNYDAIGQWRTVEVVAGTGDNPPVDASGELPDGRRFTDAISFKQLLISDLDRFAEVFTEKLATYALRRPLGATDRDAVKAIVAGTKTGGYRLKDLIEALVQSDLFRKR